MCSCALLCRRPCSGPPCVPAHCRAGTQGHVCMYVCVNVDVCPVAALRSNNRPRHRLQNTSKTELLCIAAELAETVSNNFASHRFGSVTSVLCCSGSLLICLPCPAWSDWLVCLVCLVGLLCPGMFWPALVGLVMCVSCRGGEGGGMHVCLLQGRGHACMHVFRMHVCVSHACVCFARGGGACMHACMCVFCKGGMHACMHACMQVCVLQWVTGGW